MKVFIENEEVEAIIERTVAARFANAGTVTVSNISFVRRPDAKGGVYATADVEFGQQVAVYTQEAE